MATPAAAILGGFGGAAKAIGEALAAPVVVEFGGDGLRLKGRAHGGKKTYDSRVLIKRVQAPAWIVAAGTAGSTALVLQALLRVSEPSDSGDEYPTGATGKGAYFGEENEEVLLVRDLLANLIEAMSFGTVHRV